MSPYSVHETLLRISGVNLSLSGMPILRDVHAEIRNIVRPGLSQGQVVALLGPSGVGKTQLFQLLAGLNSPDTGQVLINGDQVPVHSGMVGVVSQEHTLFRHRTVLGNLLVALKQRGVTGNAAIIRARESLKRFGLEGKEKSYPKQLSGGQKQRVAIIQQLLSSDHFLLMDEPFASLDPLMKDEACALIAEVAGSDELNTIIVTTHDIESAIAIADTIWLMGRDRDGSGNSTGARVQKIYDLAAMGLAWESGIQSRPEFFAIAREIKEAFKLL